MTPAAPVSAHRDQLGARAATIVFLAFALAYFLSALARAVTATLSPTLSAEFSLTAGDLGLLAGGYFFGFALTQLPMGKWLDQHGPRRVVLGFLSLAVVGCMAFAMAESFGGLLVARVLIGMGVSACLMAPLTGYRRWLAPAAQLRANSWMLMTGSFGMVAATLPVQWLMPFLGWRGLFWVLAGLVAVAMAGIAWRVPAWRHEAHDAGQAPVEEGYGIVWRNAYFRQMVPLGLVNHGGMVAIQTLWAGPWMVKVAGYTPAQAAGGLFAINLVMLLSFWVWGMVNPRLARQGFTPEALIGWGLPLSLLLLAAIVVMGPAAGWPMLALYCASCTMASQAQPAVALALPSAVAGRALSAYNLAIFAGVFVMQWALGLMIDGLRWLGWDEVAGFRGAFAVFGLCSVVAYGVFWRAWRRQPASTSR
ncbi:MFS transporter [Hydrogenophaga sp.]|uniref:MFS transporter n=1 Tax=Hydrogenophaga sp. TaxID=1904254 RepID=UPI0035B03E70